MSLSFPVPPKVDLNVPALKIFQPTYRINEKNDLITRIQKLTHEAPQEFSALLKGLCHPHFKITVYDASLLYDLKAAATFFSKDSNDHSCETIEKTFWQEIAGKLDQFIQEKAAFPLLDLPHDNLLHILSYLPLIDLSSLIQASSIKICPSESLIHSSSYPIKIKTHTCYTNRIKDLLAIYPNSILTAPQSTLSLKAHVYQNLSKQWLKQNPPALSKLFTLLHHPSNRIMRDHYLKQIRNPELFQLFLNYKNTKDNILLLDINPASYHFKAKNEPCSLHPLLLPNSYYLDHWKKLIENHSHVECLILKTKLYGDLPFQQIKKPLLELIGQLQNIKKLELSIQNFTQSLPHYFPFQLKLYRKLILNFSRLETLVLTNREIKDPLISDDKNQQISDRLPHDPARRLNSLNANIQKLLPLNSQIKFLDLDINCFPNTLIKTLENYCEEERDQHYSVFHLNHLLPAIDHALKLRNILEIRLFIPKPLVMMNFEAITKTVKAETLKFPQLPGQKEMQILDDKLIFLFRKMPNTEAYKCSL